MKSILEQKQIEAESMTRGDAWGNISSEKSRQPKILTMRVIMFVMKMDMKVGRLKMYLKRHTR